MLYKMIAELFVKDTVCARDHSGKRLTPTTFEGTNWGAIKTQIFDQCRPHMENKASYANAPREWSSVHQAMVVQLKKKWGSVYHASEAAWRIWAAGILKKPLYLHAANVGMAPPSNVLPSLQRVLRVADKRLAQHNMHLPLTIVNSCLEDLDGLKGAAQEFVRRLDASMCNLKAQKRMLEAMVADLQPSKAPKFGRGGMLAIPTNDGTHRAGP
ncbi:hypothetical protein DYB34_013114 [Aphanomyces astaci]|uniref:Uncharacterized protein n=1 Tax=Aphanomyces astaci TaxID=112090 RepID=A0A418CAT8_APHAT|nr:hypothetical protein DYB34_013114 [Aphanomyces astaci]